MVDKITKFELPRLDWHDQEGVDEATGEIIGRLYKDALIENFNAIENKSLELQKLDVLNISIPEPDGFIYNDSDLDTSDNNQVINLKSLIKILNLEYYPLSLSFNGTVCTLCEYYKLVTDAQETDKVVKVSIKNNNSSANNSRPYIYIDSYTDNITSSASATLDNSRYKFIGMLINNKVIHQRSQLYPSTTTIKGS